ncbi:hypothetical protein GGQ00_003096 [Salinibacter ruber]|jgi:hypothetical protein|uniref:Uncharacterized protein n=1 Tax=Salinibacter ruber TaxID=146919 RepID=A0AAW5PCW3_9BACT|nr:hypothetical protein [Salinibacter ruber]MCS4159234.1 hypothetical protein [Salinibacter ruber]MCS4223753.1 hypothetical protein [Salinibacter ruber]
MKLLAVIAVVGLVIYGISNTIEIPFATGWNILTTSLFCFAFTKARLISGPEGWGSSLHKSLTNATQHLHLSVQITLK